jgi:hypothetical protein
MAMWLASSAGQGQTAPAKEPVRIVFVARVQNVYDPGESLHEAIQVGDLMRGTITYDPETRGSSPRPGVERYEFRQAPFGILIEAGQYLFQTDPDHVDVSIELSNDEGAPAHDSFLLTSSNNLPLHNGAAVSRMSWQPVDDTATRSRAPASGAAPALERGDGIGRRSAHDRRVHHQSARVEAALCTIQIRCPSPR